MNHWAKKKKKTWILKAKWFCFHSQHQNIMSWTGYSSDWYRPRITKTQAWAVYELYMVKFILVERSSLEFEIFFFSFFSLLESNTKKIKIKLVWNINSKSKTTLNHKKYMMIHFIHCNQPFHFHAEDWKNIFWHKNIRIVTVF